MSLTLQPVNANQNDKHFHGTILTYFIQAGLAISGNNNVIQYKPFCPSQCCWFSSKVWSCSTSQRWWGSTSLFSPAVRTTTPWRRPLERCRTSLQDTGLWVDGMVLMLHRVGFNCGEYISHKNVSIWQENRALKFLKMYCYWSLWLPLWHLSALIP